MHGTGLVMFITRFRCCLWNFMVKYGNYDIYLTLDCTNSGVQISLCLTRWGLVAQYLILSLAKMVNIGSGDGLFPFDTKSLPELMYSEQTGTCCTIGHTGYQVICKYRLRYMKQWWLIREYNFHWHMNQYITFSMNKLISKWRLQNGRRHIFQASI